MKPVMIFEGPDGAGKSTLVNQLRTHRTLVVHHGPYPDDDVRTLWLRYLTSLVAADGDPRYDEVFLDRAWQSELPYAAVHDRVNRIAPWQRRMLERVALGHVGSVVICAPPYARCAETFRATRATQWQHRSRGDLDHELAQLLAVHTFYATAPCSVRYDYTTDSPAEVTNALKLRNAARRNHGPGVGAWSPGRVTLIVGERAGPTAFPIALPFVGNRGCAVWLAQQLDAWNVAERDLYWVNAVDPAGRDTPHAFLRDLRPRAIVALGLTAVEWCRRAHAAYRATYHPQFWKRFHAHEPYPLEEVLR